MIPFETLDALLMNVLMIGLIILFASVITLGTVAVIYFVIKELYLDFKETNKKE